MPHRTPNSAWSRASRSSNTGRRGPAVSGALLTATYLLGGVGVGLALALPISAIPVRGSARVVPDVMAGVVMFLVILAASWAWGRSMAIRVAAAEPRRLARKAALTYAPTLMMLAIALGVLEPVFVGAGASRGLPVHVVFGLLFVPSTFLIVAVTSFALARVAGELKNAVRLALAAGGVAALAFLAVDVFMDTIGWRVGAPGAARRATMLVVTLLGCLAAALTSGAILGSGLHGMNKEAAAPPVGTHRTP